MEAASGRVARGIVVGVVAEFVTDSMLSMILQGAVGVKGEQSWNVHLRVVDEMANQIRCGRNILVSWVIKGYRTDETKLTKIP